MHHATWHVVVQHACLQLEKSALSVSAPTGSPQNLFAPLLRPIDGAVSGTKAAVLNAFLGTMHSSSEQLDMTSNPLAVSAGGKPRATS